MLHSFQ